MNLIKPFRAIRPPKNLAHLLATRSYLSYKPSKLKDKLNNNPYSFLHIINPDYNVSPSKRPAEYNRFKQVKAKFKDFCQQGFLTKDSKALYYIYKQTTAKRSFVGFVAGVSGVFSSTQSPLWSP